MTNLVVINHILLTVEAIKKHGLILNSIILNKQNSEKEQAMDNFEDLKLIIDTPLFIIKQDEVLINSSNFEVLLNTILTAQ